jgi:hypothetical protein
VRILPVFFLSASFIFCTEAWAESWHLAYELVNSRIEIDDQSIVRNGRLVSWREREVMLQPVIDEDSLRKIREVQWRKQADCQSRQIKILSRTAFSEDDALAGYEGVRPDKVIGRLFSKLAPPERKSVEVLCGQADSGNRLSKPAGDRPALSPAGQDFVLVVPR